MEDHNSQPRLTAIEEAMKRIMACVPKNISRPNLHVLVKKSRSAKSGELDLRNIVPKICENYGIDRSTLLDVHQRRYDNLLIFCVPDATRDKILTGKSFLKVDNTVVELRTGIPSLWRLSISHIPSYVPDEVVSDFAAFFPFKVVHQITTKADTFVPTSTLTLFLENEPLLTHWPTTGAPFESARVAIAKPLLPAPGSPPTRKKAEPKGVAAPGSLAGSGPSSSAEVDERRAVIAARIATLNAELNTLPAKGGNLARKKEISDQIKKLKDEDAALVVVPSAPKV